MTLALKPTKRIRLLPPDLINRIAAGEVVERPASAVKELIENALDAGATRIEITVGNGGRTFRIADNGHGISPDDLHLAFVNHATSKLFENQDLEAIETLGFRGEALASLAAISRLTAISRTADASIGSQISFPEGSGQSPVLSQVGCAPGTILEIDELFFNTPARLKFLKRPQTELAHVEETVQHLALCRPDVCFSLIINGHLVFETPGTGILRHAVATIFKLNATAQNALLEVAFTDESIQASSLGLAASPAAQTTPGLFRSGKKPWLTFINGRVVRCSVSQRAIENAYQSLIPEGNRSPLVILQLRLPANAVDVNVHPAKREIRYADPQRVFAFVRHAIRQAIEVAGAQIIPQQAPLKPFMMATPHASDVLMPNELPLMSAHHSGINRSAIPTTPVNAIQQANLWQSSSFLQPNASFANPLEPAISIHAETQPERPKWRVIGQLFNTYILLETIQGLMVVDQHIASERAGFETLTRRVAESAPVSQRVLAAVPQALSVLQVQLLEEYRDALMALGFDFSVDTQAVTLLAYPNLYPDRQHQDPTQWLLHLLETLEDQHGHGASNLGHDLLIATLACHSAVRAGDVLTPEAMSNIIGEWLACCLPWTCPHGRPIAHTIRAEELNKFFDRPSMPVNAFI
ncbi:MAG: DNA mismatch repair endonuclease MutL [Vampirovibrionales bacterium]|nr:DNA mismatch repair endonuclease MutL [Vampirovibrionales bacterium]